MSLGTIRKPGFVFNSRRAAIARWAMANHAIGDVEVDAGTLTPAKIRALREVCANGSPLAEDCDVAVGDLVLDDGNPDDNIAMATDRIVDAINARVRSRNKEP